MFGFSCAEWTIPNVLIRIVVSMILGCVIGLDRGLKKRGAGTKTNTIVCLGATLVMLTAQYMEVYFPGKSDLSRMASQVISGVGFLGVGTIIVSGHQVRGLTTAASLWACACVGLAVGIGFLDGGVIITVCVLISLHVLPRLEKYFFRRSKYLSVYVELETNGSISDIFGKTSGESDTGRYYGCDKGENKENTMRSAVDSAVIYCIQKYICGTIGRDSGC